MDECGRIGRLSIAPGGLEANLLGGTNRCFVQAVTETLHHTQNSKLAGRFKNDFKYYFSFNPQISGFGRISRGWLGNHFGRNHLRY